jgi:hypothetical protein
MQIIRGKEINLLVVTALLAYSSLLYFNRQHSRVNIRIQYKHTVPTNTASLNILTYTQFERAHDFNQSSKNIQVREDATPAFGSELSRLNKTVSLHSIPWAGWTGNTVSGRESEIVI